MESKTRNSVITPDEVSQKFNIWIEKAKGMLRVTTHKGIINEVHLLHQRYIVAYMQLNRKSLNARFYNYHLLAKTKSLVGNMGA